VQRRDNLKVILLLGQDGSFLTEGRKRAKEEGKKARARKIILA